MAEYDALVDHKMTLLEIQNQIALNASLQHLLEIDETGVEVRSVDGEVIHENLHYLLDEFREDRNHAALEGCGRVAKTKGHSSVGEGSKRTCESCFLLILQCHWDLVKTREAIEEAVM